MGGFYIGRYEVGDEDATSRKDSSGTSNTPVEMQSKYVYNYITWYDAYDLCKQFSKTSESVESCLIYSCLWDATLEYLVESENKTYEDIVSTTASWGNYQNATFSYVNLYGDIVEKEENSVVIIPTGSTEYTNSCNIYDLGGNISEWSQMGGTRDRFIRGSYYSTKVGCVSHKGNYSPVNKDVSTGCRCIIYLK